MADNTAISEMRFPLNTKEEIEAALNAVWDRAYQAGLAAKDSAERSEDYFEGAKTFVALERERVRKALADDAAIIVAMEALVWGQKQEAQGYGLEPVITQMAVEKRDVYLDIARAICRALAAHLTAGDGT